MILDTVPTERFHGSNESTLVRDATGSTSGDRPLAGATRPGGRCSAETVRAYEWSRRRPSRNVLEAILSALQLDRWEANEIRHELGYAGDYLQLGKAEPSFMFTAEELAEWIEHTPWPQFVVDENMQIVLANAAARAFWQIDMFREYPLPQTAG